MLTIKAARQGLALPRVQTQAQPANTRIQWLTFGLNSPQKKLLSLAQQVDGENRYNTLSWTNELYRQFFPRENGVIVYCSHKGQPGEPEYEFAREMGQLIGKTQRSGKPLFVVTGGGPGLMRAVAEGATQVDSHAVGVGMEFIGETPSTDVHPEFHFTPNFSVRIDGYGGYEQRGADTVIFPGGFGTEEELLKKANELYFNKTLFPSRKRMILVDYNNYFTQPRGFLDHMNYMIEQKKVYPGMRDLFVLAKTPQEIVRLLKDDTVAWTTPKVQGLGVSPANLAAPGLKAANPMFSLLA